MVRRPSKTLPTAQLEPATTVKWDTLWEDVAEFGANSEQAAALYFIRRGDVITAFDFIAPNSPNGPSYAANIDALAARADAKLKEVLGR